MTNADNDSADELIARYLAGEASGAEEQQLLSWLKVSEENRRHYAQLKKAFELSGGYLSLPSAGTADIDIDHEWDRFKEGIREMKKSRRLTPGNLWLRIAATVILLVVTGGVLYYFTAPGTTIYQTAANRETVTLPDGSRVALNYHTLLSYDPDFGEHDRTVRLRGEAFFEVEADRSKPFVILADQADVVVVGTSFNVNAYDSLREIEVVVQTGVVSFGSAGGDRKVRLEAGQKGTYSKTGATLATSPNDDVNFSSWTTGHIVFVESDLRSVIATLEKTYHAEISVSTDIPASCIVTVTFDHQTLASVLKVLESTLNLKYTIKGNKVEITGAGC
ncbi:MAG TPA: FecR domain-containing protein [Chryseosolibacter sp.]